MVGLTLDFYYIYYMYDNRILARHFFQGHCKPLYIMYVIMNTKGQ